MEPNQPLSPIPPNVPGYVSNPYAHRKENAPSAIAALILSIVSLSAMAVGGWIVAIIAMNHVRKAQTAIDEAPGRYNDGSVRMVSASRKMSRLGLIFGLLGILVWALYIGFIVFIVMMAEHSSHTYPY
jgi:hypothetical protein